MAVPTSVTFLLVKFNLKNSSYFLKVEHYGLDKISTPNFEIFLVLANLGILNIGRTDTLNSIFRHPESTKK